MMRSRRLHGWSLHPLFQMLLYFTYAVFTTFAVLSTRGPGPFERLRLDLLRCAAHVGDTHDAPRPSCGADGTLQQ
jgi:hypothetical protein